MGAGRPGTPAKTNCMSCSCVGAAPCVAVHAFPSAIQESGWEGSKEARSNASSPPCACSLEVEVECGRGARDVEGECEAIVDVEADASVAYDASG